MALDILKGRKCMVWTFMGNARMYTALKNYGDRLSQVGLFSFKVDATGTITETGVAISDMLTYINKYLHITWLLTVRNDGVSSVFTALRENTDGAQDKFLTELVRIMEKYPWCAGVTSTSSAAAIIPRTPSRRRCSAISGTRSRITTIRRRSTSACPA